MKVDVTKIKKDTENVFLESKNIRNKLKAIKNSIDENTYRRLHPLPLTPLAISIDCDLFVEEIKNYEMFFEQWGKHHSHLPRYGLSLVNLDGKLKKNDPTNGSLYEWNSLNKDTPIIESDCKMPTEAISIKSLTPLKVFDGYWYRSNILKWGASAEFKPHIDNMIPAPWIRLWGTTDPKITINFYYPDGTIISPDNIERGRLYIIDTSLVHDAKVVSGEIYQFFMCLSADAADLVEKLIQV